MLLPCYIEGALWLHITYNPYLLAKLVTLQQRCKSLAVPLQSKFSHN